MENKFGTGPVRRAYFGLTNTDMCGSRGLDNVAGFIHAANYPKIVGVLKFSLIDLEAQA